MEKILEEVFEKMKTWEKEKRENIIHAFTVRDNLVVETEKGYFAKRYFDHGDAYGALLRLHKGNEVPENFEEIQRHDYEIARLEALGIDGAIFLYDTIHNKINLLELNKDKPLSEKIAEIVFWPEFEGLEKAWYDPTPENDGWEGLKIKYRRPEDGRQGNYTLTLNEEEVEMEAAISWAADF